MLSNIANYKNMNIVINIKNEEKITINNDDLTLTTLDVIIEKNNIQTHFGNFYIVLNNELNSNIKIVAKELIKNIDYIIFENSRFIGVLEKNKVVSNEDILNYISTKHIRKYDIELKNIYLEFFDLDYNSKQYKEYSYFLEMEFISHGIPDNIKSIYLKSKNKSILDYTSNELNYEISSIFKNDYSDYVNPYEYDENNKKLEKMKKNIKKILNEIENMEEVLESVEDLSKKVADNSKVIMEIDIINSKIAQLNIFNLKKINLNKKLNGLKKELYKIDEIGEIDIIKSKLINKELINNLTSIIIVNETIKREYKIKSREYNKLLKQYNDIYEKIEDYKENKIDISNIRERLDSI